MLPGQLSAGAELDPLKAWLTLQLSPKTEGAVVEPPGLTAFPTPISPLSLCPSQLFPAILHAAARVYSPESALSLLTHFQGLPTALWIMPRLLTGHNPS